MDADSRIDTPFGRMRISVSDDIIRLGICPLLAKDVNGVDDHIVVDGHCFHVWMELRQARCGCWACDEFGMQGQESRRRHGSRKLREHVQSLLEKMVNEARRSPKTTLRSKGAEACGSWASRQSGS